MTVRRFSFGVVGACLVGALFAVNCGGTSGGGNVPVDNKPRVVMVPPPAGTPTPNQLDVAAVSDNGEWVTGTVLTETSAQAYRWKWRSEDAPTALGITPGFQGSFAAAASADGSVIVGSLAKGQDVFHPMMWTSTGGMVDMGLPTGFVSAQATGVSPDGKVIVGNAVDADDFVTGWRWTANDKFLVVFPNIPMELYAASQNGASMVGTGIAGLDSEDNPIMLPYVINLSDFEEESGQSLGFYFESALRGSAKAITPDSTVIVGNIGYTWDLGAVLNDPITPFRWTATTGMVLLSPNSYLGSALATSPSGDVIVGYNYDDEMGDSSAFVWDDALGVFSIPGLIDQAGLSKDITGRAISAVDLSKGGKVIVGTTRNFETFAEGAFVVENILTVARGD